MSSIQNSPISYNPAFKSNYRQIRNEEGDVINRNSTNLFRGDLDWNALADLLNTKYEKADKVNVICYGCSDGSEPASVVMLLKETFKDDSHRFLPIIAKDKDEYIINEAKNFEIALYPEDFYNANVILGTNRDNYLHTFRKNAGKLLLCLDKTIKDNIQYEQADILEDIHTIPSKNSVVFCRNFWSYLSAQERELAARRLSNRLKDNCLLVIGDYDKKTNTRALLESVGFKETSIENCFVKCSTWN